jgi:hypothetical protein
MSADSLVKQGPVGDLINRLYKLYLDGDVSQIACIILGQDDSISIDTTMSYPELLGSFNLTSNKLEIHKTDMLLSETTGYDY